MFGLITASTDLRFDFRGWDFRRGGTDPPKPPPAPRAWIFVPAVPILGIVVPAHDRGLRRSVFDVSVFVSYSTHRRASRHHRGRRGGDHPP